MLRLLQAGAWLDTSPASGGAEFIRWRRLESRRAAKNGRPTQPRYLLGKCESVKVVAGAHY
jgi:hypothetical protein